jgi:hypothetical protein
MFDENFKFPKDGLKKDIHTYSVMCERDSSTKAHFERLDWISELQAGAVYARNIVAEYRDDTGEHISNLNSYYNELTVLYWVWKNTSHDYTGICHYRRRFESEIALLPLLEDKTDVVLPLPFVVGQDLRTYYQHWGYDEYYAMMLEVIRERFADYYETACWCANHIVFLPNNICITKRAVLEEYCAFLFGVINEVEVRIKTTDIRKQNRCWLSEHVTTVYFMHYLKSHPVYFAKLKRIW